MEGTSASPPSLCFRRSPTLSFRDAVRALMSMPVPPRRPDLEAFLPDDVYYERFVAVIEASLSSVKSRPLVQALIATCGLDDEDLRALMSYKVEHPYPLYRWFNGWLQSDRRDPEVVNKVGPMFKLMHGAMRKLPVVSSRAARAAIVKNIPALRATFDAYEERLAPGSPLNFWAYSSFSTKDEVINSEAFIGGPGDDAIVYVCAHLTGVDMEPFKPDGMRPEHEVLPLCPSLFTVHAAVKIGAKLTVTVNQIPSTIYDYVAPDTQAAVPRAPIPAVVTTAETVAVPS